MKLPGAVLLAICILTGAPADAADCGINQKTLDQRAVALQRQYPGGLLDKQKREVTWRHKNGDRVSVRHAGCMDLGTEIRVTFGSDKPIAEHAAIEKLLSAVRTYRDSARADAIAEQISSAPRHAKREEWRYQIEVTPRFAAVSWLDG